MQKLKTEIKRIKRHNLEYYQSHLNLVEDYLEEKPDISIETCKAIIEGISKLSLHVLTQEPLKNLNKQDVSALFKNALNELQKGRGYSDVDMVRRLCAVVHQIGVLRNGHGDIGHGKASLKEQIHDEDFADLIIGVTDNLCTYMLKRLDLLAIVELEYEDNEEFNAYLDSEKPLGGKVKYSRALFDQEFETYEIELEDYRIENEIEDQ